jgi:hypothetical protein
MRTKRQYLLLALTLTLLASSASAQIPSSSLSTSRGNDVSRMASRYFQLPPGAYVMAYGGQQFDATVAAQAQTISVSFSGFTYTGSISGNRFVSTQTVTRLPALDGELTDNGVMSGHYLTVDPRGAPRSPVAFTLTMRGAGPTIHSGSGQSSVSTSMAAQQELKPKAPPPKGNPAATKPGESNAINPQPLPPKPDWGGRSSINPQPLPPEPNWGTAGAPR